MVCQKFVADCTGRWIPEGAWVRGGLGALNGHPGTARSQRVECAVSTRTGPPEGPTGVPRQQTNF